MAQPNRREFFKVTALGGASVLTSTFSGESGAAQSRKEAHESPEVPVAVSQKLQNHTPFIFYYPDKASPCLLIKTGSPTPEGVGTNQDIVAFSAMCTHMGCTVFYDSESRTIKCPCHFSVFDPEKSGQMVCGQATADLPRIHLKEDPLTGQIVAIGITGHLYGRVTNVL
jgi:arsenite oxidase small subunit